MKKKKTTRTIELAVERNEFFALLEPRKSVFAQCVECGRRVQMVTPEDAARAAGVSPHTIFCRVAAGTVHFMEMPAGALLVCLDSI